MNQQDFTQGIKIKSIQTKYGEILKVGINTNEIFNNPVNEQGWLNSDFKKSKNNTWYAVNNTYKKEEKQETIQDNIVEINEEEIPF